MTGFAADLPLRPPPGVFAAYIFDCDGTLAETMGLHYQSWLHAIRRQVGGAFEWEWSFFCSMGGMSTADTITVLNRHFGLSLDEQRLRHDTDAFLENVIDTVAPRRETVALARRAAQNGLRVAVASGGYRKHVQRTLRAIGVEDLFPVVVTNEDVPRVKPAPDLFLLAAQKLGVAPSACLVIEDSPKGREAAEAAGMACLLVEPK